MDAMSCFAPLPFLSAGPAAYTDADIASALRFSSSMASADSSSSSSSYYAPSSHLFASAPAPAPQSVFSTTTCCDSVLVSHSAAPRGTTGKNGKQHGSSRKLGAGAASGGRAAGKRRARASKRAPTTYISTDPTNFRLMVQHVTGAQANPYTAAFDADAPDSVLLVDDDAPVYGSAGHPLLPRPADDVDAAALHHHHQQQYQPFQQQRQQEPCFPTLDSWSVMYESSELAAALIADQQ